MAIADFMGSGSGAPTTDEIDHTTPEERNKLVGYCETHQEWYKFINDPENPESRNHPGCGAKPSHRTDY